jgi:hypothetical protein
MDGQLWITVGTIASIVALACVCLWAFNDVHHWLRNTAGIGALVAALVAAGSFITSATLSRDEVPLDERFAWLEDIVLGDRSNMPVCVGDDTLSTISYSWDTKSFDYDWTVGERAETVESVDYLIVYSNAYETLVTYPNARFAFRRQLRFRVFTLCPYVDIAFNKFQGTGEPPWASDYRPTIDWYSDPPDEDAARAWLDELLLT